MRFLCDWFILVPCLQAIGNAAGIHRFALLPQLAALHMYTLITVMHLIYDIYIYILYIIYIMCIYLYIIDIYIYIHIYIYLYASICDIFLNSHTRTTYL